MISSSRSSLASQRMTRNLPARARKRRQQLEPGGTKETVAAVATRSANRVELREVRFGMSEFRLSFRWTSCRLLSTQSAEFKRL